MRGMRKRLGIAFLIMIFTLTGCAKAEKKDVQKGQDTEATVASADTLETDEDSVKEGKEELTFEQLRVLSEEGVALLYYCNQERDYNTGMSFAVALPKLGEKVLLKDAGRLWPYDREVLSSSIYPFGELDKIGKQREKSTNLRNIRICRFF